MLITIRRRFEFAAAHQLNGLRDGHKCGRMHGHNYEVWVELSGSRNAVGMVLDAEEIDEKIGALVRELDHRTLNEIDAPWFSVAAKQPTAENVAACLLRATAAIGCPMSAIEVGENGRLVARAAW